MVQMELCKSTTCDGKFKVCLSKPAYSVWIYREILYFISNVCVEILLRWFYFSKYNAVVYHILFFTFVWTGFAVCYEMLLLHIYLHIIYMSRQSFKRSTPQMWQNTIQGLFYLLYQHLCCGLVEDVVLPKCNLIHTLIQNIINYFKLQIKI